MTLPSEIASTSLTFESTSRYVVTPDGVRLHYHEAGTGEPVIFMHGGGAGSMAWTQFCRNIDELSQSFRVLMFDLPQYGRSDKPTFDNETMYDGCARLIVAAMKALELPPVHVVGVSQGAAVAVVIAAAHPEMVRRLVLASPAGVFDSILAPVPMDVLVDTFEYYNPGPPERDKLVHILHRMVYDRGVLTDEIVDMRWEASRQPATIEAMRHFGTVALGEVRSLLSKVGHPSLVLWGLEDRCLPLDAPLVYVRSLQNAELVMLQRVGHWIPFERSTDFNRLVRDFLVRDDSNHNDGRGVHQDG